MDGASKFVRGDAIAGIIITLINIFGGFVIGVAQQGMSMLSAAQNYTLLTVGDGLVSQIPALIISTAAGILVSRAASEARMGREFSRHILANPTPIYIGSGVTFLLGLVPGLPAGPFMFLATVLGGSVYLFERKRSAETDLVPAKTEAAQAAESPGPEDVEHLLALDVMELEVGYGLIPLVDKSQDGSLLNRIRGIRRQFASEMGMVIPPIHIRDNLKLKPPEYRVLVKGVELARGEVMVNHLLAMDPGDVTQKISGIPTTEPAFNLPALWIPGEKEEDARFAGYTVVDNATVVATHLTEVLRSSAPDLLGRQEVQHLLDTLAKTSPKAVEELVPALLPLGIVQKVLQNLLREQVSIRDLLTVVETLADYAPLSRDPDLLTEYVRQKLARTIVGPYVQSDGMLPVITVDAKVEDLLTKGIQHTEHGAYLSLEPGILDSVTQAARKAIGAVGEMGLQAMIVCSPMLRRHLKRLLAQASVNAMVISQAEIIPNIRIQSLGRVKL
jgi:flagellar biosynthesis protein FlhA